MHEGGQPAERPGDPCPKHHAGRKAERRDAEDDEVEGKYRGSEHHDRGQLGSGFEQRLRRHQRRHDGNVQRNENVFDPAFVEARRDQGVMGEAEGGEDEQEEQIIERARARDLSRATLPARCPAARGRRYGR
jgi:hypothetical protein